MNLSPEALEQVLTDLADRADAHHVIDRVPAVRSRARRNAQRRAGALAGGLAVLLVLVAGLVGSGGLPLAHDQGPAKQPVPAGPFLSLQLLRDPAAEIAATPRQSGGRVVVVDMVLHGRVPQVSGYRAGDDVRVNLSELLLSSDGGNTTVTLRPTRAIHCDPGAPLVNIDLTVPVRLEYDEHVVTPRLGPHDLAASTGACLPVGLVLAKLTVTVVK